MYEGTVFCVGKLIDISSNPKPTLRETLERRYKNGLSSFLLIVSFTAVNLIMLLFDPDRYVLFSANIPYLLGDYAMYYSGRYPEKYYAGDTAMEFFGTGFFAAFIAAAVACILFYYMCWFFARKGKDVWLVSGLVFFVIDTLVMLMVAGISLTMLPDIIFHIWILVSLWLGISAHLKLKALPAEGEGEAASAGEGGIPKGTNTAFSEDTPVLRAADLDEKGKVFLKAETDSLQIIYRRAKRFNELIVNGKVYDEYEVLVETDHTLSAIVGGHKIEAVYDGKLMCYILVDDKTIAKKARLI